MQARGAARLPSSTRSRCVGSSAHSTPRPAAAAANCFRRSASVRAPQQRPLPPPPAARHQAAAAAAGSSSGPDGPLSEQQPHTQPHHPHGSSSNSSSFAYVWHELYFWHCAGPWGSLQDHVQPMDRSPEHAETKRRLHSLVTVSGLLDHVQLLRPRPATLAELTRAHTTEYVEQLAALSGDASKGVHRVGDESALMPGGFQLAALAAGGALAATEAVLAGGPLTSAYVLSRPPGHHATRAVGGGYCLFNNVAVAALHALDHHGLSRVAIVDYDVHHGNGTQDIFEADDRVLFISLHQDSNYPIGSGPLSDVGAGPGRGYTVNLPLPPGSGSGAYRAAFDRVVAPALDAFAPELILVSAGYDASYMDPLGNMLLGSEDYRYFASVLQAAAARHCGGRLVAVHEGGYSELLVPFCGLAFIEQLSGVRTQVDDPYWADVSGFGYQELQPWQSDVIAAAEAGPLALLKQVANQRGAGKSL